MTTTSDESSIRATTATTTIRSYEEHAKKTSRPSSSSSTRTIIRTSKSGGDGTSCRALVVPPQVRRTTLAVAVVAAATGTTTTASAAAVPSYTSTRPFRDGIPLRLPRRIQQPPAPTKVHALAEQPNATDETKGGAAAVVRLARGGASSSTDEEGRTTATTTSHAAAHNNNNTSTTNPTAKQPPKKRTHHPKSQQQQEQPQATTRSPKASSSSSTSSSPRRNKKKKNEENHSPLDSPSPSSSTTHRKTKSTSTTTTLPIVQEILDETDYYKILGTTRQEIAQQASLPHAERRLKKLYRQRALQTHPDKTGGDRRAFDKVAQAYEVLSDPTERQHYNRFGSTRKKDGGSYHPQHAPQHMSAEDLFRSFFGGSASSFFTTQQQQQQQRRPPRMRFQLSVTLEDLYRGASVPVRLPGGSSGGDRVVTVEIPRGARSGTTLAIPKETEDTYTDDNDDDDDTVVELQLHQRPHETLERHGDDLLVTVRIHVSEAWTGCQRRWRHLDGNVLHLVSAADNSNNAPQRIRSGDVQVLRGYGMPKQQQPEKDGVDRKQEFGDLYVQFQVVDETNSNDPSRRLTVEERRELRRLLRKMEGRSSSSTTSDPLQEWPFMGEPDGSATATQQRHRLQPASRSDLGRRGEGRRRQNQGDRGEHEFESPFFGSSPFPGFMPFGSSTSSSSGPQQQQQRFFWSSNAASNPFFGSGDGDDDGETQCRQM